jgi:hypothetical protein
VLGERKEELVAGRVKRVVVLGICSDFSLEFFSSMPLVVVLVTIF